MKDTLFGYTMHEYVQSGVTLLPGQQPTKPQLRQLEITRIQNKYFKDEGDSLIFSTPLDGTPGRVVCVPPRHAATMVYDRLGRVPSEEESKAYKDEIKTAFEQAEKEKSKQDLASALRQVIN